MVDYSKLSVFAVAFTSLSIFGQVSANGAVHHDFADLAAGSVSSGLCGSNFVQIGTNTIPMKKHDSLFNAAYKREAAPDSFDEFLTKLTDVFGIDAAKAKRGDQKDLVVRIVTDILELAPTEDHQKLKREVLEDEVRHITNNLNLRQEDIDVEKRSFTLNWLGSIFNLIGCIFNFGASSLGGFSWGWKRDLEQRDLSAEWYLEFAANILGLYKMNVEDSIAKRELWKEDFTAELVARLYNDAVDMHGDAIVQKEIAKRQDLNDFENKVREILDSEITPEVDMEKRSFTLNWLGNIFNLIGCLFNFSASSLGGFSWGWKRELAAREFDDEWYGEFFGNLVGLLGALADGTISKRELDDVTVDIVARMVAELGSKMPKGDAAKIKREVLESDIREMINTNVHVTRDDIDVEKRSFAFNWLGNIFNQIGCIFNFGASTLGGFSWGWKRDQQVDKRDLEAQKMGSIASNLIGLIAVRNDNSDLGMDKRELMSSIATKISRDLFQLKQMHDEETASLSKRSVMESARVPSSYFTVSNVEYVNEDFYKVTINYESIAASTIFDNFQDNLRTLKIRGVGPFKSEELLWDGSDRSKVDNFAKWSSTVLVKASKHNNYYCMPDNFALEFDWSAKPNSVLETVWTEHFDKKYEYTLSQEFEKNHKRSFEQFFEHDSNSEFDLSMLNSWVAYTNEMPNYCWPSQCSA